MNVFSFVQWNKYFIRWKMKFALLIGTFHLSPHENICSIALINIHYLYNIALTSDQFLVKLGKPFSSSGIASCIHIYSCAWETIVYGGVLNRLPVDQIQPADHSWLAHKAVVFIWPSDMYLWAVFNPLWPFIEINWEPLVHGTKLLLWNHNHGLYRLILLIGPLLSQSLIHVQEVYINHTESPNTF